jgi:hypothetical protein
MPAPQTTWANAAGVCRTPPKKPIDPATNTAVTALRKVRCAMILSSTEARSNGRNDFDTPSIEIAAGVESQDRARSSQLRPGPAKVVRRRAGVGAGLIGKKTPLQP